MRVPFDFAPRLGHLAGGARVRRLRCGCRAPAAAMGAGAGSDAAAPAAGPKAKGAGGDERAGGAQKGGNVSRPMPTPTCRIFVSNLPYTLDRKAALQAVADAGAAKGLASFTMRASNRRRKASRKARARTNQGFCLARYESEEDAARAYKAMRASGVAGRRPQLKFVTEAQAANDVHGDEGADGAGGEGAKKVRPRKRMCERHHELPSHALEPLRARPRVTPGAR